MAQRPELTPYAPLPHAVLQRTDLSAAAKLVFAALADLPPHHDGRVRQSHRRLATATGMSERTVRRAIAELERLTLIEADRRPGRRHAVQVLPSAVPAANPGQLGRGDPGQSGRGPRPTWPGTPANLATPLASPLSTSLPPPPRGVPPLVWRSACGALHAAHAAALPGVGGVPRRWHELLGEELRAGNGSVHQIEAADVLAGLAKAQAAKRSFGFRWIVLAVQERLIAQTRKARRRQTATAASVAEDEAPVQLAPADAAEAAWDALSADRQRELLQDAGRWTTRPDRVLALARQMAARQAAGGGA